MGQTPLWATSVGGGVNITSVVLEQAGDPGTSLKTDYASWYGGKNGANQLCNFLPGMRWGIEDINNVVNQNAIPFGSFVEQTAAMPALPGYAGSGRLIIYFSQAVTLSTSTVAQGALIGASDVLHPYTDSPPHRPMLPLLAVATLAQWHTVTVYDVLPEDCRFDVGNNDVGYAQNIS